MRGCCSPSTLRGISRAAWRHAAAGTPRLSGGSHHQHQKQDNPHYLLLRPPVPPNAPGLAERFFSTKKSAAKKGSPVDSASGGDPFYVVRKGDVVGIYKNLADCQAQVSNSVCDPSVAVFKGHSLRKETEEHHAARGLKNSLYSINAADARDDLFGDLVAYPFQTAHCAAFGFSNLMEMQPLLWKGRRRCMTNKAAEYRALLFGLRYAAKEGFKYIRAQGDSRLVCNQTQGLWSPKSAHMVDFCNQVNQLKGKFRQIQTTLVSRESNADAHAQAKLALKLPVGGIEEQSC